MFRELHLNNFKNFRDATLELGPFTVLVGANASGKSNLRDAFRFLHGVGRGYDFVGILDEAQGEGAERVWSGIRGGIRNIAYKNTRRFRLSCEEGITSTNRTYSIEVSLQEDEEGTIAPRLVNERFEQGAFGVQHLVYSVRQGEAGKVGKEIPVDFRISESEEGNDEIRTETISVDRDQPVFSQIQYGEELGSGKFPLHKIRRRGRMRSLLSDMRFLNLDPVELREPSHAGQKNLGDNGQNLASVLRRICRDGKKETLVGWVEKLTPMDAKDITFDVAKHSNEVTLVLVEKDGTKTPMQSASDGTLRFLGLLALLFQDDPPQLLFIEEIETGLHPTRLDLLANLIEQRTEQTDTQVIVTTHSPLLLQVLDQQTLQDAQLVYRTGDGPEARITPLLQVPTARKVLDKPRQSIRDLHSTGWFERVMAFSGEEAVGP